MAKPIPRLEDSDRTDPSEVADLIIALAKMHGWGVSVGGIELTRVKNGNVETYTINSGYSGTRTNIKLPNRPYSITQVGDLTEIKSE